MMVDTVDLYDRHSVRRSQGISKFLPKLRYLIYSEVVECVIWTMRRDGKATDLYQGRRDRRFRSYWEPRLRRMAFIPLSY